MKEGSGYIFNFGLRILDFEKIAARTPFKYYHKGKFSEKKRNPL